MTRSDATRADYERARAFRQRVIKRLKRDVDVRMKPAGGEATAPMFATFSMLYESTDGRLCLFEDAYGHLTAVDASKMA